MNDKLVFNETEILTPYLACAIAEGFCEGENASGDDRIKAWAFLIRTGQCWSLQGWFGRTARDLIESGIISPEGEIDWNKYWDVVEIQQN